VYLVGNDYKGCWTDEGPLPWPLADYKLLMFQLRPRAFHGMNMANAFDTVRFL